MRAPGVVMVVVVFAVLFAQPAAALTPLESAVAPGQVTAEAAAQVLALATREAERDGTPEEANALLEQMTLFARDFATPTIPPEASHGVEALAALAFAAEITGRLEGVPNALGDVSVILHRCDVEEITPPEFQQLSRQLGYLTSRLELLAILAAAAPSGIDATPLTREIAAAQEWIHTERSGRTCAVADEFLVVQVEIVNEIAFALFPSVAWPTAEIHITGRSTNLSGPVRLEGPFMGLDRELALGPSGSFSASVVLPEDTPLGAQTFRLTQHELTAERTITIVRAPTRLDVIGPTRAVVNSTLRYEVILASVLPERTNESMVRFEPGGEMIQLTGGRAVVTYKAPQVRGEADLLFDFAGDSVVAPAQRHLVVSVVPFVVGPAAVDEESGLSWPPLLAIGLVAVALVAGHLWRLRRARARVSGAPVATARALAWASPKHLVGLIAWIMGWLRSRGKAHAGTTVREAAPAMVAHGVGGGALVRTFEQIRYGPPTDARIDAAGFADWRRRAEEAIGQEGSARGRAP